MWYYCYGDFMFHISDCKKYTRCPRLYINDRRMGKQEYHPFVRLDEAITDLAVEKLKIQDYYLGHRGDEPQKALQALRTNDWLVKARFEYKQLRVKIPFLHRNGEGWDIYFLFNGLYPHADDIQFYCDSVWVLEGNGLQVKDIRILHLNADYVRGEKLDPEALFVISDCFYNSRNNPSVSIREKIYEKMTDLTYLLNDMESCTEETLPKPIRTTKCTGRNRCRFYDMCFPNEEQIPDNSITTLIASKERYAMLKEGRKTLKEADPERIEGSRMQYAQIEADMKNGLHVDRFALKNWLKHISYPISFLDFEWERFAVPPFEGMRPYDVLPFEYALIVMQEDGTSTRKVYLSVHDDRRDMAENLVKDIPSEGSVIAYNAEGAEKMRIAEYAVLFPDLKDRLLSINKRMEDLQLPFLTGAVYDVRMRGQWSLKTIMAMMNDKSYKDLDINQGMDAVYQWRHLDYNDDTSEEDKKRIVEDLKKYCGMDSYSMVVVYNWLKSL